MNQSIEYCFRLYQRPNQCNIWFLSKRCTISISNHEEHWRIFSILLLSYFSY